MINVETLKKKVLDLAMRGKLVPQDANDEPASVLIEKIKAEKDELIKAKKIKKTKALPPIEPDEIPYQIPDSWEWVRLETLTSPENYAIADGPFGSNLKKSHYTTKKEVRIVQLSNIGDMHWKNENVKYTTFNHLEEIKRSEVKAGNFVIAKMMPAGRAIIVPQKLEKAFVLSSDAVKFVPNKVLNSKYLLYSLNSLVYQKQVESELQGTTRPRTSITKLKKYLLPIPPLAEQKRIVTKIEEIFAELDKIESASNEYDKCKELLNKRVLDLAMRGKLVPQDANDEPANVLIEKIKAEKDELIKAKKIKKTKVLPPIEPDEIPYQIPDSWEWVRLGEIAEFQMGKTPAKSNNKYWNTPDFNWVSISDLNNHYLNKTKRMISKLAADEVFKNKLIPAGSLLMSFKLTIGKMGILSEPAFHNEAIISFNLINDKKDIFRNYLFHFLPTFVNYVKSTPAVKGKTLNKRLITNMLIPLPPLAEQKRIVAKIEEIQAQLKEK